MKTTLELPDDLMVEIKVRAAQEHRPMRELVTELLRAGMNAPVDFAWPTEEVRVAFPLVITGTATAESEVTPERATEILSAQEAEWADGDGGAR